MAVKNDDIVHRSCDRCKENPVYWSNIRYVMSLWFWPTAEDLDVGHDDLFVLAGFWPWGRRLKARSVASEASEANEASLHFALLRNGWRNSSQVVPVSSSYVAGKLVLWSSWRKRRVHFALTTKSSLQLSREELSQNLCYLFWRHVRRTSI